MCEERSDEEGCGTERGRRPSGVPQPDAAQLGPVPDPAAAISGPSAPEPTAEEYSGDLSPPPADEAAPEEASPPWRPPLSGRRSGPRSLQKPQGPTPPLTPEQRLLLLDTWKRSGLPAGDFAAMVGISKHSLFGWSKRFEKLGPAGLIDNPRGGPKGSRLADLTKRTILLLKQSHPDWGCQRISDMLYRGPGLPASPQAVARVLHEAGYELKEVPTHAHPDKVRYFERAQANQLWQTDLFTFILKRQNRRVYLVAFIDDHSRFIVGYGLHASQSTALVLEVLRAALTSYSAPRGILTDNGSQYVTWRGKSAFSKELEKRGIKQIVATPRRPQTLGKIERFWGSLWRECVESAIFRDLGDAQQRIGFFIDHYNFQRPHQGIGGLVPADRYFGAESEVRRTLAARVAANALELARQGVPKKPFYLTGQVAGQPFALHAEGERMILTRGAEERQEVDMPVPGAQVEVPLTAAAEAAEASALPEPLCPVGQVGADLADDDEPAPGTSPLDDGLPALEQALRPEEGGQP